MPIPEKFGPAIAARGRAAAIEKLRAAKTAPPAVDVEIDAGPAMLRCPNCQYEGAAEEFEAVKGEGEDADMPPDEMDEAE